MPTTDLSNARKMSDAISNVELPRGYSLTPSNYGVWNILKDGHKIGYLSVIGPCVRLDSEEEKDPVTKIVLSIEAVHIEHPDIRILTE